MAIWDWLSGKKTILAAVLTGIAATLRALGQDLAADVVLYLSAALGSIGLTHKVIKGG